MSDVAVSLADLLRRGVRTGTAALVVAVTISACAPADDTDTEPAVAEPVVDPAADDAVEEDEATPEGDGTDTAASSAEDGGAAQLGTGVAACTDLPGAEDLDVDEVTDGLLATLDEPSGAFRADADLNPLTKAVLVVDSSEPELPHVRYRVGYATSLAVGDEHGGAGAGASIGDLVRVDRFNLGPARRDELLATQDEAVVAPAEEFGEGPHVSYCFEMRTIQAMTADIVAVTRAQLPDDAHDGATCLSVGCGDGRPVAEEQAVTWQDAGELDLPSTAYVALRDGAPGPAVALDLALVRAGVADASSGTPRWSGFEPREGVAGGEPFVEAVIDVGLGQDSGVDLVLREGHLMDDSIEVAWQRITGAAGGDGPLLWSASAVEERAAG